MDILANRSINNSEWVIYGGGVNMDTIVMHHWFNGWFFGRDAGGAVRIEIRQEAKRESPLIKAATIPVEDWASIVAHVSQYGDNVEYWQQALEFHGTDKE